MTPGTVVFLVGLYVVPLGLLAWGHRLRRLSARQRRAFWGAIIGHCVAGILALAFGMLPPEEWSDASLLRGFFGFWALLLLPGVGALAAALSTPAPRHRS